MEECEKYGKVEDVEGTLIRIEKFCELLRSNKVKGSRESFLNLPEIVQCMFLRYGIEILGNKEKYSRESYLTAYYLFKLFRNKEMKENKIYVKLRNVDKLYNKASEIFKGEKKVKKKYSKKGQRYETPEEMDPLYVFYSSLYKQRPESKMAIVWLTEYGVYEGEEREGLVKRYEKLAKKK